ncbi:hypothetical protein [Actinoplanes sp. M2I2]|uniref:hypothetical protein n=1 Tax=Actinoplanes sp. M2I2 TaxID=1734444 RepID=UPI0020220B15|nr:hypothetical protein [Actinoplanes sp. M2I2]
MSSHLALRHLRARTWFVALAALITLIPLAWASPASAAVCHTPGCGGTVRVQSSAGNSIAITNCWSSGSYSYGDSHSCMTNGWNNNAWNAGKYLAPGQTSRSYNHYYDVDGFRVFRGCTVNGMWEGGSAFTFYRSPSQSSMWVRIVGTNTAVITAVRC